LQNTYDKKVGDCFLGIKTEWNILHSPTESRYIQRSMVCMVWYGTIPYFVWSVEIHWEFVEIQVGSESDAQRTVNT